MTRKIRTSFIIATLLVFGAGLALLNEIGPGPSDKVAERTGTEIPDNVSVDGLELTVRDAWGYDEVQFLGRRWNGSLIVLAEAIIYPGDGQEQRITPDTVSLAVWQDWQVRHRKVRAASQGSGTNQDRPNG